MHVCVYVLCLMCNLIEHVSDGLRPSLPSPPPSEWRRAGFKLRTIVLTVRSTYHTTPVSLPSHFLDFVSKEYVEDIAIIPLEYTQNAGVRLVVIGPAQPKHIKQAFKKLTGLSYSLYVDPEREVYKALGCQDKIATAAVENSKHIKSGFVTGMLSSVWRAMTSGDKEFQGDIQQQGGAFIFGPGIYIHEH
uniref:Uncharacterized protein n=1 Tax=Biomphalaria glabrata TaxID=6526 RepID=A0A2C9KMS1_BIOGL